MEVATARDMNVTCPKPRKLDYSMTKLCVNHELITSLDPNNKAEDFGTDISISTTNNDSNDGFSKVMDVSDTTVPAPSATPVVKMPLAADIDEFFAAAEMHEQIRFAEKYNYDIVKDVPLEGRYQWVRLKP